MLHFVHVGIRYLDNNKLCNVQIHLFFEVLGGL